MRRIGRLLGFPRWNSRDYIHFVFAFSAFLLIVFSVTLYRQSQVVENHDREVRHSYEILRKSRRIYTHVLNVETGQRGYLLTGAQSFLEPYTDAMGVLNAEIDDIQRDTEGMPEQQENVIALRQHVADFVSLLDSQIRAYVGAGIHALNKKNLADARVAMERVRDRVETITNRELALLQKRIDRSRQEQRNYFITLFAGSALAILCLLLANAVILRLLQHTRLAEARGRVFEERLGLILEGVNDGIYDYDVQADHMVVSPSYFDLLGYEPAELNGPRAVLHGFVHPEDIDALRLAIDDFLGHRSAHFSHTFRMRHRDGSWRWILSRGVGGWDARGKPLRLVGTHSDISGQKLREQELQQLNQELESFAYIASHDLRSPLVNLKGFAGEIQLALNEIIPRLEPAMDCLPEETRRGVEHHLRKDIPDSLQYIRSAVEKMDVLTTAILDMSRIGKRIYRAEDVALETIVGRCLQALAYDIAHRNITVETDPLPVLRSDPVALEQIFGNIIDNAIKYLSADRPGRIRIEYRSYASGHEFHIVDNGRGIAAEDREKVFDIFRRAGNVGEVRGAGMGMAYVKATARKLGGRVWFSSKLDVGTTFHLYLPLNPPSGGTASAPSAEAA